MLVCCCFVVVVILHSYFFNQLQTISCCCFMLCCYLPFVALVLCFMMCAFCVLCCLHSMCFVVLHYFIIFNQVPTISCCCCSSFVAYLLVRGSGAVFLVVVSWCVVHSVCSVAYIPCALLFCMLCCFAGSAAYLSHMLNRSPAMGVI
jgi:hypothetical protein